MSRVLTVTAVLVLSSTPRAASACGGFFCSSAPIDQAAESVVYAFEEDGTLTMAVRVDYAGDDDDFAWILPVVAPPEISIGADALFDELARVTAPTFVTETITEGTCRPTPACVHESSCAPAYDSSGCGFGGPTMSDPWTGGFVDASAPEVRDAGVRTDSAFEPGVMVFSEGPIGPYDTVVLGAATAVEVVTWLRDNAYDVPVMSASLLEPYAAAGHVFVALRLRSNANTRVIQPVVLRMPTREACLPLRLTAIATVPRLPIVTYFLGRMQATPANYSLVELEPTDPDLWTASRSWRPMLDAAIDELGGQAFARDYAGPTPAISLALPSVNDLAGETDPAELIRALSARGYRAEPRLLELFERYVHPPADRAESPASYYDCLFLGSTDHCGEPALFDPVSLMARIDAEITTPRQEAHDLVHRHRYLTRLYTSIRARDMTVDPVFRLDEGLDDHDNVHHARRVTACSAEYYRREAPEHWEIGALRVPITSGTRADDRAYCARLGAVLASEAPACEGRSSRGGCLCWAGGTAPIQGGLLFAVGLLLGARRLRHGRGARAGRARGSREPGAGCESTWRRS